ncbi:YbjQ family protein [Anaerotignum sp.]|uniref:YbjQ family protein n=1 Tax=Anaerotignum sp. TaxID=2039241 RepID=UPI00289DC9CB|nr:heavy metal-binding domain-containing protein [Anaerotignum sp.]
MAKTCNVCGKKIGYLDVPLILNDGSLVFCEKCKKTVSDPLFLIRNAKSIDEINELNKSLKDELKNDGASDNILGIIDDFCKDYIAKNSKHFENKQHAQILEKRLQEEQERVNSITNHEIDLHMVTTGFNFENYYIEKYCGVVSGSIVLGTGFFSEMSAAFADLTGEQSNQFSKKMELAKDKALEKLIINSIAKGGNALIGVDFDFVNFSNNMIGVSANGTSVIVDSIK